MILEFTICSNILLFYKTNYLYIFTDFLYIVGSYRPKLSPGIPMPPPPRFKLKATEGLCKSFLLHN